ncbi:ClpXP adapter SpxH family protein [Virgibacillus halodenitrificans]|uniref:ClpXP adapter protein SpxH n=2 Tax=Virgibacillus halodenitrificans TaxID=1482 RepID=A0AAC9IYU0_VIRHA|nr:ClpXP adapter SpxH family protein [Virgibacillus halodenitrificans]APC47520.1 dithiol-disulfide isomerase [Virgibacillus halodenitrificans]MEC2158656.1 ClpXP adapter SpxH family protein [Virgibacillus halodenitrificans]WHX24663.1 ClpXP adapter SpxH family protein [Virgibacillus halodenitrificans]CDQ32334.1 DSBA-like thioredoxin domain protein [Virgibacillus halodenitrificans]
MSGNSSELHGSTCTNTSPKYSYIDLVQKPIEMYVFVDPLCPECWSLEPYIKKLTIEYGRFFTIQPIVSGHLNHLNKDQFDKPIKLRDIWEKTAKRTGMSCDGDIWIDNPISSPWIASLAVKAAELQGKKAGKVFLRRIQENAFLNKLNISEKDVLLQCAEEANLDVNEFENDLYSASAKKAFQCDLKLTQEMEVDYIPTIVFFNQMSDDQGIKISGLYPYDIYVRVLKEILQKSPIPSEKPPLEDFVAMYGSIATKEVAVVYDWTVAKAEKEMKKLQLKRKVSKLPAKYGNFWNYLL